ncbi:sulfotransferase family 2 domain-containing protein [Salipiger sp. PrR002]|uniref:sulfotransferase family 2 domain-containing protein n=1 Tax=Salipiger sp. PrR002 TaxID=2706489 RepID=UPI0013BC7093|nr:sulfotransferase family 2 domain-containing protein [Salipiger sp. PrR002]NDW01337.1 sulfotransferase family protein [Salipiger sp. PrR002]NDW58874.1 sulfotransferase family protein [Salipiger sp. PrR004]
MRVALVHFPKTGGTSLHDFLVDKFPPKAVCPERIRSFERFTREELQQFDYFSAHMDFARLSLLPGPLYTITVLREPKARILSLYYFWRAHSWRIIEARNLTGPRRAKELGLLEFLKHRSDGIPSDVDNYYARSLLGRHWSGPRGEIVVSDEDALRLAMRNLLTIDTIGFTEDMAGLFQQVTRRLGVEMPAEMPWARSSKNQVNLPDMEAVEREQITPEIDAQLNKLTRLDRVIYENAKRMFVQQSFV